MEQGKSLLDIIKEMNQIPEEGQFYAITLLASSDDKIQWNFQSHFVRYSEDRRREVRAPSLVKPDIMARKWKTIEQTAVVVRDEQSMLVFWHIGGNALVEKGMAESMLPNLFELNESVQEGFKPGFRSVRDLPQQLFKRAPRPKVRMQVLNRDQRRCRICGNRPDNDVHVELHLHHVRPFGDGGLTVPENLITLCHTCHKGLDPHEDPDLSARMAQEYSGSIKEALQEYSEGVNNYRRLIREQLKDLASASKEKEFE